MTAPNIIAPKITATIIIATIIIATIITASETNLPIVKFKSNAFNSF